jgi:membrane-bound acyltransferase YfiQ involved in biofilm formation
LFGWKKQMHQYDIVKRNPVVSPSFRKTFVYVILFLFLGFTLLMAFLPYISSHAAYLLNDQALYSFTTGTLILLWSFYFQLIYWESKNHMKMYMKREKGQQKLYVLGENEGKI